jgi:hypothetical protein
MIGSKKKGMLRLFARRPIVASVTSSLPLRNKLSKDTISALNGIPKSTLNRLVVIYNPTPVSTQSGVWKTKGVWRIKFSSEEKWENGLMGWASSRDPVINMTLDFNSKESAIEFAVSKGRF